MVPVTALWSCLQNKATEGVCAIVLGKVLWTVRIAPLLSYISFFNFFKGGRGKRAKCKKEP